MKNHACLIYHPDFALNGLTFTWVSSADKGGYTEAFVDLLQSRGTIRVVVSPFAFDSRGHRAFGYQAVYVALEDVPLWWHLWRQVWDITHESNPNLGPNKKETGG